MVLERIVAILAGVVSPTTLHSDRDDVERRMVMDTARLGVLPNAVYVWSTLLHGYRVEEF
jgi:hypothetical protein